MSSVSDIRCFHSLLDYKLNWFPKATDVYFLAQSEGRHSAKTLKTNTLEGLTVHAGWTEGNEEEIDSRSRIRGAHTPCHVVRPKESDAYSVIVLKLCYYNGIRLP